MKQSHSPVVVDAQRHGDSSTAGIQEAVDSLPACGGAVLVPRGTHAVRRSIRLRSNVTLRGEGSATVLARPPTVVFNLAAPTPAGRVEVEVSSIAGLRPGDEIYLTDKGQGGWYSRHMTITSIAGNRVLGVLAAGDPQRCYEPENGAWGGNFFPMVFVPESDSAVVAELAIDGGEGFSDRDRRPDFTCAAIHGFRAENLRVRGVTVRRWPTDGVGAQGGSAIVTECLVEDCLGHGYHPGSSIACSVWTSNIARRNGGDGLYFCAGVRNAVVANNILTDNAGHGIGGLSDPDANNIVSGNVIARNGGCGIEGLQALGNVIAGNLVQNNSRGAPGRFAGIRLDSHAGNVVVANLCVDTGAQATQTTAIESFDPTGENVVAANAGTVRARAAASPPCGEIRAADPPPVIDGRLDEPAWRTADELPLDRLVEDGAPAPVKSSACFLRDDRFLYVGVRCAEPLMDRVEDRVTLPGPAVCSENRVEIFFVPDARGARCCQFAVNTLGTVFERQYGTGPDNDWDSKARAAVHRGPDFWSVEIAISLETLGLTGVAAGRECRANIYRARFTVAPAEYTCWSPTRAGFFMPRRFGTLTIR